MPVWLPGSAEESAPRVSCGEGAQFVRGLEYVHVIAALPEGETQIWAGEMNQVPSVGERIRLYVGGSDAYQLFWVEAVAWPPCLSQNRGHGSQGQPYVYVK